ncbi:protein dopey-1 homolog [Anabrus simplex]|uniref:protein dopey-1 homolog n=1 Tax=Anabrus simplex TaxID=316456 RepID=UPI0035A3B8B8
MGSIALEEYELMKDSKYRVYVSAVDKALKSFEYTSEWADLISALGKLNKVLLNHMKFPVIPRRIKISKRLAQCMHPALPSGVHLKALETYDIIFKCMGTNRLSHELFIYSAGLFPLLGHAAMNVRPSLLTVYETHFVPLGERLRPGLSGFLSGVLPGLEEGSDHFERTTSLLEKVCDGVGASHFYGCLWDCLASNSGIRLPAISYVLSHFNKKLCMEDQLYIMGTNIDVMVTALCTAVQDNSVLVQRSALDLLLVGFPMHNSQLVRSDMVRLVTAALVTILRRDMSLNRRLFAWLLGSEVNLSLEHPLVKRSNSVGSSGGSYFDMYSREMLIQAIKITLNPGVGQISSDVRPYRLLVSLLDKPDIGPVILDDILYEVFRALYLSCEGTNDSSSKSNSGVGTTGLKGSQELLKSANLLFSTLEPCYIWLYTGTLFSNACKLKTPEDSLHIVRPVGSGVPHLMEVCALTEFLVDTVSLEAYMDTPSEHLPGLFLHIVTQLTDSCDGLSPNQVARSLQLCAKILSRVQPSVLSSQSVEPAIVDSKSKSAITLEVASDSGSQLEQQRSKSTSDLSESSKKSKTSKSSKGKKSSKFRLKQSSNVKNYSIQAEGGPILLSVSPCDTDRSIGEDCWDTSSEQLDSSSSVADISGRSLSDSITMEPVSIPTVPTKQQSVLEECLRQYEVFYVKFLGGQKVIKEGDIEDLFKRLLIVYPHESDEERTAKLEVLLYECLKSDDEKNTINSRDEDVICRGTKRTEYYSTVGHKLLSVECANDDWEESMKVASSLLVELSTFPTYCLPEGRLVSLEEDIDIDAFPEWLRVLLVCACWLCNSPRLQLIAISTLLDLISLLRVQSTGSSEPGVVSVVLVPLLRPWHVHYIENRTNVVQVLARALWHHLGRLGADQQVMCVELLHQLHNVLPANDAVEDVVGESLMAEDTEKQMEAFERFALLWHIGREVETKSSICRNQRTFDKSLLKMLDNLLLDSCPLKLQAQSWLLHSLLRGDIARVLDPLLFMLLDPNTARMSVLHVSIEHSNTVLTRSPDDTGSVDALDENSAKIYAISSVDGNVIYHVSDSTDSRSSKCRTPKGGRKKMQNNPVRAKRIFAVTTLVGGGDSSRHYITEKNSYVREIEFPSSIAPNQNISVFVNPFSAATNSTSNSNDSATEDDSSSLSKPSATPEILRNATRLHPVGGEASLSRKSKSAEYIKRDSFRLKKGGFEEGDDSSDSNTAEDANGLIRRWSVGEEILGDVEPTPAESPSKVVVEEILHDVLDVVVRQCSGSQEISRESSFRKKKGSSSTGVGVHQLHSHMLLYCGVYDSNRTLYALRTLRNVLLTNARMFLCSAATTGIANIARSSALLTLLTRHRKSVFGRNFHGEVTLTGSSEYGSAYRSSMYLEVLITVCLYFARSYYPNLGQMRLTHEEIAGNRQVQLASSELLMLICSELIFIVRDSGKGFACYIADLLSRCKVQKVVLHCILSSVYNMSTTTSDQKLVLSGHQRTFTEEIVRFNDPVAEHGEVPERCRHRGSEHSEGFQVQLLRLLLALIMLEHQVNLQKGDDSKDSLKIPANQQKYVAGVAIPHQPMFLAAILTALKLDHMRHLHQHWTTLVTSALPFMGQSLTLIVMSIVNQLCCNVEKLAKYYGVCAPNGKQECCLPPDYAVTQLEALTVLCHYCLLDSTQQQSHAFTQQLLGGVSTIHMGIPGANPGQIFNNLVHVFMPTPLQQELSGSKEKAGQVDQHVTARFTVLSNMPRIIASVAALWQAVMSGQSWEQQSSVPGSPRMVKHQLLEFLSPISLHHGINFLAAIAVAWQERKAVSGTQNKVVPAANRDQQVLVYLVDSIRVMPIDTLVQTVHQVVKQPPPIQGARQDLSLEVSVLEFFYCYMQTSSGAQLAESWGSLLGLLRDGLTLTPPAQFLMLAILNEFVQKCPPFAEKKDQRDLQDITAKLVESCAQIAGACLEQTTWLRRNLAVREEDPATSTVPHDKDNTGSTSPSAAQYSVQAQSVLAELLAPLLDVSYGSQEKEKVVALLTALMYNITPYLKNHTRRNLASFHACSQLLASLSSYQYTRKAWRKDVFDLLLDPALFQMEASCLAYWRTIVDNLMTHDTTTFRDLMSRVSLAQSGSLSIFSSREQEYEQRAQLLKRLAFVILCSETDQYHKYMPEIQERLSDSLRLPQVVPSIQAQVFLCFRVLLLRMSPQHVTSMWPIIISELVQVFLHIEQELSTDSEEFRRNNSSHIRLLSALDYSWVVNSNNGLHAQQHPHWLQLELAAAKLLDMALVLPAHRLPQFQMYRWAFVGGADDTGLNNNHVEEEMPRPPDFVPHVTRLARLMDIKFQGSVESLPRVAGQVLITANSIRTLQDLHPFFTTLSLHHTPLGERSATTAQLEAVIESDFLEKMPAIR